MTTDDAQGAGAAAPAPPDTDPRCGQPTAAGRPCRNRPVEDGRCRLHARRAQRADGSGPSDGDRLSDPRHRRPGAPVGARSPDQGRTFTASTPPSGDGIDILEALGRILGDDLAAHLDRVATFLRHRFTGDYEIDEFGLDPDLMLNVVYPLLQPLYRHWWRVSSHGRQHLPSGGGLIVANHAGTLPADGLMLNLDVWEATGRHARELGADLVFATPFVNHLARKTGVIRAATSDAHEMLSRGGLAAVFPEGFKGLGKPFGERYKLERFGRGGFVATALRARVPIIPTAIVGSEEIWPLLWDSKAIARALGLPYFPIVVQMLGLPFLGPIALLPLPSKWSITYGLPIDTADLPSSASEDPMIVFELADQVRGTIQDMLTRIVMGRQSVFF